jgi:uncharacterized phage-associated protein
MPYSTKVTANTLLSLAEEKGIPVSLMKLQKLLYYAAGTWHLLKSHCSTKKSKHGVLAL